MTMRSGRSCTSSSGLSERAFSATFMLACIAALELEGVILDEI
jgi:hypothetical protein